MADLFLMVGLPGAGKTTYAQKLAKETGVVRFTPDEWHIFLFGDDFHQVEQEIHDSRHDRMEDLMWKVGQDLLQKGVSVILDFGFWVEEQREEKRLEAAALGAETKVCFLELGRRIFHHHRGGYAGMGRAVRAACKPLEAYSLILKTENQPSGNPAGWFFVFKEAKRGLSKGDNPLTAS